MTDELSTPELDRRIDAIFRRSMCFDRQHNPITYSEMVRLKFMTPGYDIVARTYIRTWEVSTVWLGWDSSVDGLAPLIFETAIFKRVRGRPDVHVWHRYPTEKAALRGHVQTCRMIHSGWRGQNERATRRQLEKLIRSLPGRRSVAGIG
jgi:hypothetical protein